MVFVYKLWNFSMIYFILFFEIINRIIGDSMIRGIIGLFLCSGLFLDWYVEWRKIKFLKMKIDIWSFLILNCYLLFGVKK